MRADIRLAVVWVLVLAGALPLRAAQADLPAFRRVAIQQTVATHGDVLQASLTALPGGRFEARHASIAQLAALAFNHGDQPVEWRQGRIQQSLILNLPRVFRVPVYSITAEAGREWTKPAEGESYPAELRLMLRRLLEERFDLKARIDARRIDVYVMRLSKKTGVPGPSLVKSANDCVGPFSVTSPSPAPADKPRCAFRNDPSGIEAGAVTMAALARILTPTLDRYVVDETGLVGSYDVRLVIGLSRSRGGELEDGSSFYMLRFPVALRNAMKDQLGLELHRARLMVPTLVIERWNPPH